MPVETTKCPMPECSTQIRRTLLACRPHWYALPAVLRQEVSAAYRARSAPGGHRRHLEAVRAAYRWYAIQTDMED